MMTQLGPHVVVSLPSSLGRQVNRITIATTTAQVTPHFGFSHSTSSFFYFHTGCGKTTLLDCLSLRLRSFEGALRLNGDLVTDKFFNSVGYCYQDELFCGYITPYEHLHFHATNSLSSTLDSEAIEALVDKVRIRTLL